MLLGVGYKLALFLLFDELLSLGQMEHPSTFFHGQDSIRALLIYDENIFGYKYYKYNCIWNN